MIGIDEKRRNEWKQNEGLIMKDEDTTERVRTKSQKRNKEMNGNDEMEWNERIGMEMDKSECDWSGWEEEWYGNGCIKNMDDNRNEQQGWLVMRVMDVK